MDFVPYAEAVAPGARSALLLEASAFPPQSHLRLAQRTARGDENVQQYDAIAEGQDIEFDVDPQGGPVRAFAFLADEVNNKSRRVPAPTHTRLRPLASAVLRPGKTVLSDQWNKNEYTGELRVVAGEIPTRVSSRARAEATYARYHEDVRQLNASARNFSSPVVEGIFLPAYRLPDNVVMPAWGFYALGYDRGPMPQPFLRALVEAACFMHNADIERDVLAPLGDFVKRANSTRSTTFAYRELKAVEIVCDAFCLPATMTDYVSDRSRLGKSVERMFAAVWAGAGDCEDDFKQIQLTVLGVQRMAQPGMLQSVVDFAQLYEVVGVTGMATTPSLQRTDARETTNQDDYICHVWAMLMPSQVLLALEDGMAVEPETALEHLGNLVLEGTNFTTALQRAPIEIYSRKDAERAVAERDALFSNIKRLPSDLSELPVFIPATPRLEVPRTAAEQSRFYRFGVNLWTPRGEFRILHADTGKIGITFQELLGIEGEWTLARTGATEKELESVKRVVAELDAPVLREPSQPPDLTPDNSVYRRLAEGSQSVDSDVVFRVNHINELTPELERALEGKRYELSYFPFYAGNIGIVGLRVEA